MAHTQSYDAVVLRCTDIGEADRFCILFTRERGRLAAMAKGVRRLHSRMGGVLLPGTRLSVECCERGAGFLITGAHHPGMASVAYTSPSAFLLQQKGLELVLTFTEDAHPLPSIFDLLAQYIALEPTSDLFALFTLRLLFLLGLLPLVEEDPRFRSLLPAAKKYASLCARSDFTFDSASALDPCAGDMNRFIRSVLQEHLQRALKSEGIAMGARN